MAYSSRWLLLHRDNEGKEGGTLGRILAGSMLGGWAGPRDGVLLVNRRLETGPDDYLAVQCACQVAVIHWRALLQTENTGVYRIRLVLPLRLHPSPLGALQLHIPFEEDQSPFHHAL